jgi:hypothetical protein
MLHRHGDYDHEDTDLLVVNLYPKRGGAVHTATTEATAVEPSLPHPLFYGNTVRRDVFWGTRYATNAQDRDGNWRFVGADGITPGTAASSAIPAADAAEYGRRLHLWFPSPPEPEGEFLNPYFRIEKEDLEYMRHIVYSDVIASNHS